MISFAKYKKEFDKSFAKESPEDFVSRMEQEGYKFKDYVPVEDDPIVITCSMRVWYMLGAIKCMLGNLKQLFGYIWEDPSATREEIMEYASDCKLIWNLHTTDDGIKCCQKLKNLKF